ncbi:MAG: hypothetical protein QOI38_2689 [Sphingomonadales bacterium]|jgi:hypothetical protein|nr:hypothetical protein [Sphingomonadales bacterium]
MNALLLAFLLSAPARPATPDQTDIGCYRLMAELARAPDPEVRTLGLTAAQYFLGRIDAAAPGYEVRGAPISDAERPDLVRRCGERLHANGFDLRALRAAGDGPRPTV